MTFTDQLNRTVLLPAWPPQRIVSLVPSQTELLCDLGLEREVVGITKFCIHPRNWFETKTRIGGTKTLNFEKIATLKPDLIIGNKEENERAQIEQLAEQYPVWMSDVATLEEAYDMMRRIGKLTGKTTESEELIKKIKASFGPDHPQLATCPPPSAAYFIWRKPYMAAGGGTFIDAMMRVAGFKNVFANKSRYPEISLETLAEARPEIILLSSEPYPFREKHLKEIQAVCPDARVRLVDGELFSWYGSRLLHSAAYFRELSRQLQSPASSGN